MRSVLILAVALAASPAFSQVVFVAESVRPAAALSAAPCPCGGTDTCPCGADCPCPGCPHRTVSTSEVPKSPPLVVTVADRGCGPCDRWEREVVPALAAKGWKAGKDFVIRRVPFGSATTPAFSYAGKAFSTAGYVGRSAFLTALNTAMGRKPKPVTKAVVVPTAPVVPRDPRPGHWSYPGDIASHLRNTHGINPTGMTREQMLTAHDLARERGWRPSRAVSYAAPRRVYRSCPSCPGGRCP